MPIRKKSISVLLYVILPIWLLMFLLLVGRMFLLEFDIGFGYCLSWGILHTGAATPFYILFVLLYFLLRNLFLRWFSTFESNMISCLLLCICFVSARFFLEQKVWKVLLGKSDRYVDFLHAILDIIPIVILSMTYMLLFHFVTKPKNQVCSPEN